MVSKQSSADFFISVKKLFRRDSVSASGCWSKCDLVAISSDSLYAAKASFWFPKSFYFLQLRLFTYAFEPQSHVDVQREVVGIEGKAHVGFRTGDHIFPTVRYEAMVDYIKFIWGPRRYKAFGSWFPVWD